jgi:lipoate---protein ligase
MVPSEPGRRVSSATLPAMTFLDLTLPAPAGNLACDEALLDLCDGSGCETLRFWESPEYFVVVGYANPVATEVNRAACEARGIPILRRCSGGGTVLQGPGCLNYSLALKLGEDGPLHNITSANRFIMDRNRLALERALGRPVAVAGHTDLTVAGVKFSGNAQRRKRHALLFHGSFLLDFNLSLISALLPMPSRQPDYRGNRSHETFLTNLAVAAGTIKHALRQAWQAHEPLAEVPQAAIASLARNKYATDEWNFKF